MEDGIVDGSDELEASSDEEGRDMWSVVGVGSDDVGGVLSKESKEIHKRLKHTNI